MQEEQITEQIEDSVGASAEEPIVEQLEESVEEQIEEISGGIEDVYEVSIDYLIEYGPTFLLAIIVLFVGLRLVKLLQKIVSKSCQVAGVQTELEHFLSNVAGWIFRILLIIAVIDMIGVNTTSFVAIIGAAGLAVGLALQGTMANFAGGVLVLLFKPYKIGDLIESQNEIGRVKEIQIFNTIIITFDNKTIIMPNGAIMNNHLTNFTVEGKRRIDLIIGVSYEADIKKSKEVLMKVLESDDRILKDPAPTVGVKELGDSSVNFAVFPWVHPDDYWEVYLATMENCKIALDEANISIPFPQRDVHIYKHTD